MSMLEDDMFGRSVVDGSTIWIEYDMSGSDKSVEVGHGPHWRLAHWHAEKVRHSHSAARPVHEACVTPPKFDSRTH